MKRLYRSRGDRRLAGVCGGIGQYLGVDSTPIRLLLVAAFLCTGCFPVFIAYILAWAIVPEEPCGGAEADCR